MEATELKYGTCNWQRDILVASMLFHGMVSSLALRFRLHVLRATGNSVPASATTSWVHMPEQYRCSRGSGKRAIYNSWHNLLLMAKIKS